MKRRVALVRHTPLETREGLDRTAPPRRHRPLGWRIAEGTDQPRLRAVPPRPAQTRPRLVSAATPQQKAKVAGLQCLAARHETPCRAPMDPAHLIDRSLAPEVGDETLIIVPLCRAHHDMYDEHRLDLSPYLEPHYRAEVARAVEAVGLFAALRRITGLSWKPEAA